MTQMPPTTPQMQPHRGVIILVFSILSWFLCVIFGIVAWVMANSDLRAMAEGRMDPQGEGLTKAGKILSIISVILNVIGLIVTLAMLVLGIGFAAAGAAAGGGGGP